MKSKIAIAFSCGIILSGLGQPLNGQLPEGFERRVVETLLWRHFWLGNDAYPTGPYRSGKVWTRTVRSDGELAVMIASFGVTIVLHMNSENEINRISFGAFFSGEDNEKAGNRYIRERAKRSGCVAVTQDTPSRVERSPPAPRLPFSRVCRTPSGNVDFIVDDVWVNIPRATIPTALQERLKPRTLESVASLVESTMRESRVLRCTNGSVVIPFFGEMDPWIYVLIEGCGERAVQLVHPDGRGGWEFGTLLTERGAFRIDRLAGLIQSNVAATVKW